MSRARRVSCGARRGVSTIDHDLAAVHLAAGPSGGGRRSAGGHADRTLGGDPAGRVRDRARPADRAFRARVGRPRPVHHDHLELRAGAAVLLRRLGDRLRGDPRPTFVSSRARVGDLDRRRGPSRLGVRSVGVGWCLCRCGAGVDGSRDDHAHAPRRRRADDTVRARRHCRRCGRGVRAAAGDLPLPQRAQARDGDGGPAGVRPHCRSGDLAGGARVHRAGSPADGRDDALQRSVRRAPHRAAHGCTRRPQRVAGDRHAARRVRRGCHVPGAGVACRCAHARGRRVQARGDRIRLLRADLLHRHGAHLRPRRADERRPRAD